MAVEIREVSAEELDRAGEATVAGYASFYGERLGYYADYLRDVARRTRTATVLVALVDGEIAGTVTLVLDPASAHAESLEAGEAGIRMLSVDPRFQQRGIGRALSLECIQRARAAGACRIVLHADEEFPVAHKLYSSLGFRRAPGRDFRPDDETFLLAYELDLA